MMEDMSDKKNRTVAEFLGDGGAIPFTIIAIVFISLMVYGLFA